jgi:hypothetical protein
VKLTFVLKIRILVPNKKKIPALDNKSFFITKKIDGLKWVREIKSKLIKSGKRRRKIHGWVGNKRDIPCQLWAY